MFAAQRWKGRRTGPLCKLTPSLVVLLHPAAIHLVDIAGKKCKKNTFSKRTNSRRTCVRRSIEAKFFFYIKKSLKTITQKHYFIVQKHNYTLMFKYRFSRPISAKNHSKSLTCVQIHAFPPNPLKLGFLFSFNSNA